MPKRCISLMPGPHVPFTQGHDVLFMSGCSVSLMPLIGVPLKPECGIVLLLHLCSLVVFDCHMGLMFC